MAVDKIADTLNEEFTKPRAGERWYATSVYRVLKAEDALSGERPLGGKEERDSTITVLGKILPSCACGSLEGQEWP
jgi:hypothetical protein